MTTRWLSIVGIGEDGLDGVSPRGRRLLDSAETLVGGDRHLGMLPDNGRPRLTWPHPLTDLLPQIAALRNTPVCVLATGDPMFFGIGVTLANHFPAAELEIVPSLSAFSLAAARLGWPLADTEQLTLHGRALSLIIPFVQPGARLLILADGPQTPMDVAQILKERGYGGSNLTVLEHMGGPRERVITARAAEWVDTDIAPLNTIAVKCVGGKDAIILPRLPGLPDEVFANDGNFTKREVRAATLAALAPIPGEHLWDVGAGCGSVSIEWMRSHASCRATAVEKQADRIELIARNALSLGVPRLGLVEGEAPDILDNLEAPDAVFIGGGASSPGMFRFCWEALNPRGRLVANAVTTEAETALFDAHNQWGGVLTRIAVSRTGPVGSFNGWQPLTPVTQLAVVKH